MKKLYTSVPANIRLTSAQDDSYSQSKNQYTMKTLLLPQATSTPTPEKAKKTFRSEFFIYVFGIYPFTHLSKKQKTAMKEAHVIFNTISFHRLCFHGIYLLAANLVENN